LKIVTDSTSHFDTLIIDAKASGFTSADFVASEFHKYGMNLRVVDDTHVGISINETTNLVDLDEIIEVFADLKQKPTCSSFLSEKFYENRKISELPKNLQRTSKYMQQPQFNEITSET
jgi:glycine dehydrogenase